MTTPETKYLSSPLSSPVIFLNSTVLSFNGSLGFGSQESTITVELIEDCENGQVFANGAQNDPSFIGSAVCFPEDSGGMAFSFCGIITNWNKNDTPSGVTYSVTLSDPRRILENVAVIVDTYSGEIGTPQDPYRSKNIYNVYGTYEPSSAIATGTCNNIFGTSGNINDRGMPYQKIVSKLQSWPGGLVVYSPTGFPFTVDLTGLPSGLPEYYRVNGPSISLLQLITDICEATGNDFYVYLDISNFIHIKAVNLNQTSPPLNWIENYGVGNPNIRVTDRSFGRELRVEKQKNLIFGEKVHYLNMATDFIPFFGENMACNPVVAESAGNDLCGFRVLVNTAPLAASMRNPNVFGVAGNLYINEIDLRCNHDLWWHRVVYADTTVGLSEYAQKARDWIVAVTGRPLPSPKSSIQAQAAGLEATAGERSTIDNQNNPDRFMSKILQEHIDEDKKKIFGYLESLANTYYGKQFLAKIYDKICYKQTSEIINNNMGNSSCISSEIVYSAVPTNDGGWIEPGESVMDVGDPYLGFFRQEDGRVGPFALFSVEGTTPNPNNNIGPGNSGGSQNTTTLSPGAGG